MSEKQKIRLFSMFSGFGGAEFALKKAGIDFECIGISETDKYAIQCFNQNFPGIKNFGDCTKINPNDLPDFDLLVGGFPCTDVSIAGKQDLNKGRTILFNEIIRIAEVKKPKFILLENVKGLLSKKFQDFFEHTLKELDRIEYNVVKVYDKKKKRNLVPVFNSKEYGIPQNRQRVFYICSRKDIDFTFKFPEKEELKIFLKDILEKEVDEKYYLSEKQTNRLFSTGWNQKEYSNSIRSGGRQSLDKKHTWDIVKVGNVNPSGKGINGNVYAGDVSLTITTNKGEGAKIIQLNNQIRRLTPTECFRLQGFTEDQINLDGLSNTQKYKLAGNGFKINLVSKIFKEIFK